MMSNRPGIGFGFVQKLQVMSSGKEKHSGNYNRGERKGEKEGEEGKIIANIH